VSDNSDCLFCQIVAGVLPSTEVDRTETTYAFRDINPAAPVHVLVVPAEHVSGLSGMGREHSAVWADLLMAVQRIAQQEGIAESGYRLVVNQGAHAGQTVHHLHLHVLGGRPMAWPPE